VTDQMTKSPADVLDYDIDFGRWLKDGDTITAAASTIADTTAAVDRTDFSETMATVWLSGGADGETGTVTTLVSTNEGRTKEFCFKIRIKECR
jgi:hypothetical protein